MVMGMPEAHLCLLLGGSSCLHFPAGHTLMDQPGSASSLRNAASQVGAFLWVAITFPGGFWEWVGTLPRAVPAVGP